MKTFAKSVVAVSIALAGSTAFAETAVFPSSAEDAPAFSVVGQTRADRYASELAPAGNPRAEIAPAKQHSTLAPAWWRRGSPAASPIPERADG
jgi:hypothetical protein